MVEVSTLRDLFKANWLLNLAIKYVKCFLSIGILLWLRIYKNPTILIAVLQYKWQFFYMILQQPDYVLVKTIE